MAISKADMSFYSGQWGVAFSGEGAGTESVKPPDATGKSSTAYIKEMQLCCASTVQVHFYDGSTGDKLPGLQCISGGAVSQLWDFGMDGLKTLGNKDNTDAICVSVTGAGLYTGYVKGYWGS